MKPQAANVRLTELPSFSPARDLSSFLGFSNPYVLCLFKKKIKAVVEIALFCNKYISRLPCQLFDSFKA